MLVFRFLLTLFETVVENPEELNKNKKHIHVNLKVF